MVRQEKLRATTEAAFRDQASPNPIGYIWRGSAVVAVTRSPPKAVSGVPLPHCNEDHQAQKKPQDVIWTLLPQKIGT